MPPVLDVHDVTVAYHRKPVLWDIDLTLAEPSLVGIVGPNGAGKSTLIKAILGLVPLASGSVRRVRPADRQAAEADRLCAAARKRRLGFSGQRARRGADGHLRPAGLVSPPGRAPAAVGSAMPGTRRPGRVGQSADRPALGRPAAAHVSGPGVGPAGRNLFHGRADGRRRRRHGARHLQPARANCAAKAKPCWSCTTICAPCRNTSSGSCCSTCGWWPPARPPPTFTPENLHKTYGGRLPILDEAAEAVRVKEQRMNGARPAARGAMPARARLMARGGSSPIAVWRSCFRSLGPNYNTLVVLAGTSLLGAGAGLVGSLPCCAAGHCWAMRWPTPGCRAFAWLSGLGRAQLAGAALRRAADRRSGRRRRVAGAALYADQGRRGDRHRAEHVLRRRHSLSRIIQTGTTGGSRAGLDSLHLGKTAGMIATDVYLIAGVSVACLLVVLLCYKEFKLVAFDPGFRPGARLAGRAARLAADVVDRRDGRDRPAGGGRGADGRDADYSGRVGPLLDRSAVAPCSPCRRVVGRRSAWSARRSARDSASRRPDR